MRNESSSQLLLLVLQALLLGASLAAVAAPQPPLPKERIRLLLALPRKRLLASTRLYSSLAGDAPSSAARPSRCAAFSTSKEEIARSMDRRGTNRSRVVSAAVGVTRRRRLIFTSTSVIEVSAPRAVGSVGACALLSEVWFTCTGIFFDVTCYR
jgi:hypothetical protein